MKAIAEAKGARVHVAARSRLSVEELGRAGYQRLFAVDEEVEIDMGPRPDVQVQATTESRSIDSARAKILPLIPGVLAVRSAPLEEVRRIEISNALPRPIQFELRLQLYDTEEIFRADHPLRKKNGRPLFEFTLPANGRVTVRYQTRGTDQ